MIFHENCLLADNSHEISYLIFFLKLGKMLQNLSSAAVVIGALRVIIGCCNSTHILAINTLLILAATLSSADHLCKEFGSRSGPIECRS